MCKFGQKGRGSGVNNPARNWGGGGDSHTKWRGCSSYLLRIKNPGFGDTFGDAFATPQRFFRLKKKTGDTVLF